MKKKELNKRNEIVVFAIGYIIIIMFLVTDVYVFVSKESFVAKTLASVSFIGFMFLITPITKLIPNLKG